MLKPIVTEELITFKELEEKVFQFSMEIGRMILQKTLETQAEIIDQARDKSIYRNKGNRKTVIKTKLGEVEYERPLYLQSKEKQKETGKKSVYLLDQVLEINRFGKISENLVDVMITNINELSYRKTAENISTLTGQVISGMAVWNVIQNVGEGIRTIEHEKILLHENDKLIAGTKEIEILFQESDGVYFTLQGKDRKKKIEEYKKRNPEATEIPKSVRKKELKVATTYEGWKKIGKNRHEVIGKEFFCGYTSAEEIANIKSARLYEKYNMANIKIKLLNSDGATWIRETGLSSSIYQLDCYHIKSKIRRHVLEQEDQEQLIKMFWEKKYDEMIFFAEELKYKYGGEVKEVERLQELQNYLLNNKDGLKRYYHDKKIKNRLLVLSEKTGLKYRHMGVQESQNYCVLTRRMKRRRMSFSIRGSENLAKVLCAYHSESYVSIGTVIHAKALPTELFENAEKYMQEIEDNIARVKELNIKPKAVYVGNQASIFGNYPHIRNILKNKAITDLTYI